MHSCKVETGSPGRKCFVMDYIFSELQHLTFSMPTNTFSFHALTRQRFVPDISEKGEHQN